MSRITIEVTEEQHHKIKVMASIQKKTIKELVLDSILEYQNKQYNHQTLHALEDVENNHNLNSYKTVSALFNKLGI